MHNGESWQSLNPKNHGSKNILSRNRLAELNIKFVYKHNVMTTTAIRQKLMTYLADADDSKVKAIYALVEDDMNKADTFKLTDEQLNILDTEREMHLTGKTKSYTRQEANQIIRDSEAFNIQLNN